MKYYFDISLSRQHVGTPHGLARVEVSLAKEFLNTGVDIAPIWIDENWNVCQGNPEMILNISDGSHSKTAAFSNYGKDFQPKFTSVNFGILTQIRNLKEVKVGNRLITIGSYSISFLPKTLIPCTISVGKKFYRVSSRMVQVFRKHRTKNSATTLVEGNKSSLFKVGLNDVVVIAGNDWDRRVYEKIIDSKSNEARLAFIVYDLIPYQYSYYSVDNETASRFTYWIGDIGQRATFLFFISKYSQSQFNKMLKDRSIESTAKQMVINLPPGLTQGGEMTAPGFVSEIDQNFVLVVCTIEARKNHQILVSALRLARSKNESFPQLVFIGSPGWGTESLLREIRADENLMGRIIIKSGVSDAELRWLYEKCIAVAYPSIVEGFGLPVFESAVFKKPIVTSDIHVFDEIPHPLRFRVNPYDTEGWKIALQSVGARTEPEGGWKEIELPTWEGNVKEMIAFMSEAK